MKLMIQLGIALAVLLAVLVGLFIGLDFYRSVPKNVFVAPLGQDVVYGDHGYAVLAVREELDLGRTRPSGRFVILTLRVSNYDTSTEAYPFRPERIRIEAEHGKEIRLSSRGQAALTQAGADGCSAPIEIGSTCTIDLAFDVPPAARDLRARVGHNLGVIHMLERVIHGAQFMEMGAPTESP